MWHNAKGSFQYQWYCCSDRISLQHPGAPFFRHTSFLLPVKRLLETAVFFKKLFYFPIPTYAPWWCRQLSKAIYSWIYEEVVNYYHKSTIFHIRSREKIKKWRSYGGVGRQLSPRDNLYIRGVFGGCHARLTEYHSRSFFYFFSLNWRDVVSNPTRNGKATWLFHFL